MKGKILFSLVLLLSISPAVAQEPVGIFDGFTDVGEPAFPGLTDYDEEADRYTVDAVGTTIGDRTFADEFHYAYKEMTGSFAIEAEVYYIDIGRGGLMIRQSLDPDSQHASLLMASKAAADGNSDAGSPFPTIRSLKGGATIRDGDPDPPGINAEINIGILRLEKFGNSIYLYTYSEDPFEKVLLQEEVVPMENTVLAGLAASAEQSGDAFGIFDFEGVVIEEYPLSVYRDVPTEEFETGANLSPVTITASVRADEVANATITEVIPYGATASNVSASAGEFTDNGDGTISWILTDLSGDATLTYDVTLGGGQSAAWQGTFTDGVNPESYIGGDAVIPTAPTFPAEEEIKTFDVNPSFITLMQAEDGFPYNPDAFGLLMDPRTQGGITVLSMNTSAGDVLEFILNIQEAGTYYLFGKVRGEDGNSDSFHTEVDATPAGDNTTRWHINNAKEYQVAWVSDADPGRDPRPFELSEGEHYFYLGNREDSASIDWLAVTSDPNLNLSNFQEIEQQVAATRVLPDIDGEVPATIDVTVNLAVKQDAESLQATVVETIPPGSTASNIEASIGSTEQQDGTIVWSIPEASDGAELTYTVTPAEDEVLAIFSGTITDNTNGYTINVIGDVTVPSTVDFMVREDPIEIGSEPVIFQAEMPHEFGEDAWAVIPDPSLPSKMYVEALTNGQSGGSMTGEELVFNLNVLESNTYYLFCQVRSEGGDSDSFFVDFDVEFEGNPGEHAFGLQVSPEGEFGRVWYQTIDGPNLWDTTGEPRPFELDAGEHVLRWNPRETESKVDWIGITNNPELDIEAILEPGQPVAVTDYMLY